MLAMIPGGWYTKTAPTQPPSWSIPVITISTLQYRNLPLQRTFSHFQGHVSVSGRNIIYNDINAWVRFTSSSDSPDLPPGWPNYLAGVYLNVQFEPAYRVIPPLENIQLDVSIQLPEWVEDILITSDGDYIVVHGRWYIVARRRV